MCKAIQNEDLQELLSNLCLVRLAHQRVLCECSSKEFNDDLRIHIDGTVLGHRFVKSLDFLRRHVPSSITSVNVCNRLYIHEAEGFLYLTQLVALVDDEADDRSFFHGDHREPGLIDVLTFSV